MPRAATIADIQSLARREALNAGRKILGVTASTARYVSVPDADDAAAVFEFVTDVHLLEGPSQALVLGTAGGLKLVENVLIAHEAVGNLVADLQVPVELERLPTGQLQITGRAKVALPALQLDEYSYDDLGMGHLSDLRLEGGVYRDAFGYPVSGSGSLVPDFGPTRSVTQTVTTRLSTLAELVTNDEGTVTVNLGVNPLQRMIISTTRSWTLTATETARVGEERT